MKKVTPVSEGRSVGETSSYRNFAPKKGEAIFNISISAVNPWDPELNSDTTLDQGPFLDPCQARIFFDRVWIRVKLGY